MVEQLSKKVSQEIGALLYASDRALAALPVLRQRCHDGTEYIFRRSHLTGAVRTGRADRAQAARSRPARRRISVRVLRSDGDPEGH